MGQDDLWEKSVEQVKLDEGVVSEGQEWGFGRGQEVVYEPLTRQGYHRITGIINDRISISIVKTCNELACLSVCVSVCDLFVCLWSVCMSAICLYVCDLFVCLWSVCMSVIIYEHGPVQRSEENSWISNLHVSLWYYKPNSTNFKVWLVPEQINLPDFICRFVLVWGLP